MLLMDIITWEPRDSAKVGDLYANYEYPEGMKVIDEWIDPTGYRMFVIYETEGNKMYALSISPFIGLCRFETIPVMKADKYMQMAREHAEKTGGENLELSKERKPQKKNFESKSRTLKKEFSAWNTTLLSSRKT